MTVYHGAEEGTEEWNLYRPSHNHLFTDLGDLDLCETYCSCGTPDPYNLGHTESCAMSLPIDILREVEAICANS